VADKEKILQTELRFFEKKKHEWLPGHLGDYVVIAETTVAGFYLDYESALKAGLHEFGVRESFLVKQVWAEDPVYFIA
jgi:hypothetical protein